MANPIVPGRPPCPRCGRPVGMLVDRPLGTLVESGLLVVGPDDCACGRAGTGGMADFWAITTKGEKHFRSRVPVEYQQPLLCPRCGRQLGTLVHPRVLIMNAPDGVACWPVGAGGKSDFWAITANGVKHFYIVTGRSRLSVEEHGYIIPLVTSRTRIECRACGFHRTWFPGNPNWRREQEVD